MRRRRRDLPALELRQARRTQLREDTTTALFILDALDPTTDDELHAAADDLLTHLTGLGPGIRTARRLISSETLITTETR